MFKRRNKRSWARIAREAVYPRGGWTRAFHYVKHRVRRLPDRPERIARGIAAGVFVCFTPLYGLHFVSAYIIAKLMRGNGLAALLATFFGNPLTFPVIATISLQLGRWLVGTGRAEHHRTIFQKFGWAARDLQNNLMALFSARDAHWGGLAIFYRDVFLPYLIGGLIPGIIAGLLAYYFSMPLIAAYQNRRKGLLAKKIAELGRKAGQKKKSGQRQS